MFPRSPGPSSTVSGFPVSTPGSPGRTPEVSSYTWMTVFSPRIWMTSPISCSAPTNITSYMRGRSPIAVTPGPATRSIAPVPFTSPSVPFALVATMPTSLEQIHADGPLHLRPEVLVLRGPDRDDDGPRGRLETAPHRVTQALHVRGVQDQDADLGIVEDLRELLLDLVLRNRERSAHTDELEPLDEVVPADRRDLHAHTTRRFLITSLESPLSFPRAMSRMFCTSRSFRTM